MKNSLPQGWQNAHEECPAVPIFIGAGGQFGDRLHYITQRKPPKVTCAGAKKRTKLSAAVEQSPVSV